MCHLPTAWKECVPGGARKFDESVSAIPGCKIVVLTVGTASKLYRPQAVADGNFKLENLKMRNPSDDVRLSDGEMFFVGSASYNEHLRITPERKQASFEFHTTSIFMQTDSAQLATTTAL